MTTKTYSNKDLVLAMVGVAMLVGVAGGTALIANANAQTTDTTTTATNAQTDQKSTEQPKFDPSKGGHTVNGKTEEVLTGDTAEKVKTAALKAVPDATIDRAETDVDGTTYEAHMTKADGSHVTVLLDANFNVTSTEEGYGPKK